RDFHVTGVQTCALPISELRKRLEEAKSSQEYSTLTLDDSLEFPEWYTEHTYTGRDDIHLVPGGYWQDPLVGEVYDLGGSVYRLRSEERRVGKGSGSRWR